jgi:hypothetical protein
MRWVKDQKVEANLRALGIPFEVERVERKDIDVKEGLRRQTRLIGRLNDDAVIQMACAMGQPEAAFPMVILQKPPRALYWPWSGNHRLAAWELAFPEDTSLEAYVVCLKDTRMMDVLPRIVNAWESTLGFSKEEKIANARYLVEHHSMSVEEAANLLGIKPGWVVVARRAEDVRARIGDLPGVKTNGIPSSTLVKLSPLSDNLNVLRATARTLCTRNVKGDEARRLIADVQTGKTELQQLAELGRWEKLLEERDKPRPKTKAKITFRSPVRDSFLRHLSALAKMLEKHNTLEKLQCTDASDRDMIARSWIGILTVMDTLARGKGGAK